MEITSCVKQVIISVNQYKKSKTEGNMVYLQRQLEILVGLTNRPSSLKFFNLRNMLAVNCLNAVIDLLRDPRDIQPCFMPKFIAFFQHLAQDNDIKETLHESFHLTPCLADIIKTHGGIPGDHLTVEVLNLLQKITYGHKIDFHDLYVEDLLHFVLKHITKPVTDFTLPCLKLLVNLCRENFAVQSYIKNLDGSRSLYKTLMSFMDEQNHRDMMIFALCCISNLCLHQDIGQTLFNPKNIKWTFQLMFNILLNKESVIMRQYAVDLFGDLLKNHNIQQSLVEFGKLSSCIEGVLNQVSTGTTESVAKIFELLLSLCAVEGIRPTICKCILSTSSIQHKNQYTDLATTPANQIKEPLFAIVHWASQPAESHDQAALLAIDFLTEFYEEMIYSNTRIQYSAHADLVLPLAVQTFTTKIEGDNSVMKKISNKIIKALQLCLVLTGEEDIKRKLLGMVNMQLFSGLLEFQFSNNKVATHAKVFTPITDDISDMGVEIVMYTLDLMAKLAKSLPEVDALFSSTLQDSRIVPFLSAGLTSDHRTIVQVTLQIICFASMLDAFPTVLLGDALAASNSKVREDLHRATPTQRPMTYSYSVLHNMENKENVNCNGSHDVSRSLDASRMPQPDNSLVSDASVQSIIDKMKSGLELKGGTSADIIDMYEHKLQSLQTKEEQLQDLLEAKSLALVQADRLISQHRSRKACYEAEAANIKRLLRTSEMNCEKSKEEMNELKLQRERLQNTVDTLSEEKTKLDQIAAEHRQLTVAYSELSDKYTDLDKVHLSLEQEHKTLTEMHEMSQKHMESLKQKFDVASEQIHKMEGERKQMVKTLKEKESKLGELSKSHTKLEKDYKTSEAEREQLEEAVDKHRANIAQLEKAKKELNQQVTSLELVCSKLESEVSAKDKEMTNLRAEVEKHRQIAALINSLSSGKSENVKL